MRQRTFAAILVAVGLVLLVVLPAIWQLTRPDSILGDVTAIESSLRDTDSAVLPADVDDGASLDGETGATPPPKLTDPTVPGPAEALVPPVPVGLPVGLRIHAIDVDAPVVPHGVDRRTGDMDVPENVTEVAWYEYGPRPGDPGSAVLAAHVDLAGEGPGVFFDLSDLEPGDRVSVEYEDGDTVEFRVIARVVYDKDEIPLDVIFSREGPAVLTMITCGGGFNRQVRSYDSNVVVYAVPALDAAPGEIG